MMIELTQMEYGCTGNVLEQSYKHYAGAIIDKNWITIIWAHLDRCKAANFKLKMAKRFLFFTSSDLIYFTKVSKMLPVSMNYAKFITIS
jgi:hypothetical protein